MHASSVHHSLISTSLVPPIFPNQEITIQRISTETAHLDNIKRRFQKINSTLLHLIQAFPPPCFLLRAVLQFCETINDLALLPERYTPQTFEFWLIYFSDLSISAQEEIRGKIAGQYIPRSEYQSLFPIGMGKVYSGNHFIAAHLSPDVDTTVASLWGWVDAFAARVGSGLHCWFLPGGAPNSPVTELFEERFGKGLFSLLPETNLSLSLSARDLLGQHELYKEEGHILVTTIDHGHQTERAILLVDREGYYLGEWHGGDAEKVRQISILFKATLHWLEHFIHTELTFLFSQTDLSIGHLFPFCQQLFAHRLADARPILDLNPIQQAQLDAFYKNVLHLSNGMQSTLKDLNISLSQIGLPDLLHFEHHLESLGTSSLFDSEGKFTVNRALVFSSLQEIIQQLNHAILRVLNYMERLDVGIAIKHSVLGLTSTTVSNQTDLGELKRRIENREFLTVTVPEGPEKLFPIGVIRRSDLYRSQIATLSLRDFSNLDEIRLDAPIEVISVVDHHKSALKTTSVPTIVIGDVQSCNVLLAEVSFARHDRYSMGNQTLEQIEEQLQNLSSSTTPSSRRITQRLIQRQMVATQNTHFFVDPTREFNEYFFYLLAILDDTDLLSKVSARDVLCVAQLINRLKSLSLGYEVEVIHFDHLTYDDSFPKIAAQEILKNEELYSIYHHIHCVKEKILKQDLLLASENSPQSQLFLDTKEQNGCARVGQIKLFGSLFSLLQAHLSLIQKSWVEECIRSYTHNNAIDLHILMVSTIPTADEMYRGELASYTHQDELWIWTPQDPYYPQHLLEFLARFYESNRSICGPITLIRPQTKGSQYEAAASQIHFDKTVVSDLLPTQEAPMCLLRFNPGTLNSRKTMISPFLPKQGSASR